MKYLISTEDFSAEAITRRELVNRYPNLGNVNPDPYFVNHYLESIGEPFAYANSESKRDILSRLLSFGVQPKELFKFYFNVCYDVHDNVHFIERGEVLTLIMDVGGIVEITKCIKDNERNKTNIEQVMLTSTELDFLYSLKKPLPEVVFA